MIYFSGPLSVVSHAINRNTQKSYVIKKITKDVGSYRNFNVVILSCKLYSFMYKLML